MIYAARCGAKLLEAKAGVAHGEWNAWVDANCRIKKTQVQKYMRLARDMPELADANKQSTVYFEGIDHAIALLTADDETKAIVQEKGTRVQF